MKATFNHLSIIISSKANVSFYSKLGFKEFRRIDRDNDTVVLMDGNGMMLELFVDPSHPKRATSPENLGVRYFALKVDDFDSAIKDFECSSINNDWYGKRYCFIFDPDGLPVQIHE